MWKTRERCETWKRVFDGRGPTLHMYRHLQSGPLGRDGWSCSGIALNFSCISSSTRLLGTSTPSGVTPTCCPHLKTEFTFDGANMLIMQSYTKNTIFHNFINPFIIQKITSFLPKNFPFLPLAYNINLWASSDYCTSHQFNHLSNHKLMGRNEPNSIFLLY